MLSALNAILFARSASRSESESTGDRACSKSSELTHPRTIPVAWFSHAPECNNKSSPCTNRASSCLASFRQSNKLEKIIRHDGMLLAKPGSPHIGGAGQRVAIVDTGIDVASCIWTATMRNGLFKLVAQLSWEQDADPMARHFVARRPSLGGCACGCAMSHAAFSLE